MEHYYENIQGWFDYQDLYTYVVNLLPNPAHIVEVGAWKGRSTAYLCVEIKNSNKDIKLDVVDIWTGETNDPKAYSDDKEFIENNRDIFPLFKKNLEPTWDMLTAYQMPSVEASEMYADKSLDFVYIDANHSYEFVKEDLRVWLPKVKDKGIIAGHDYNPVSWPGVIKAVNETFVKQNLKFFSGSPWLFHLK